MAKMDRMVRMRERAWGFVRCAIGQARDRPLPPIDGDRLIAIRQDQAILHYREMSGSGDPALQKRGRGQTKKSAQGGDKKPRAHNIARRGF